MMKIKFNTTKQLSKEKIMNDNEVLCKIEWTVADVRTAFRNKI